MRDPARRRSTSRPPAARWPTATEALDRRHRHRRARVVHGRSSRAFHDTSVFGVNFGPRLRGQRERSPRAAIAGNSHPAPGRSMAPDGTHQWDSTTRTSTAPRPPRRPWSRTWARSSPADDAHVVRYNADGTQEVDRRHRRRHADQPEPGGALRRHRDQGRDRLGERAHQQLRRGHRCRRRSTLIVPATNGGGYSATNSPGAYGNRFYITTKLLTANGNVRLRRTRESSSRSTTPAASCRWPGCSPSAGPAARARSCSCRPPAASRGCTSMATASPTRPPTTTSSSASRTTARATFSQIWSHSIPAQAEANAAHDPRAGGGLWVFGAGDTDAHPASTRTTGAVKQQHRREHLRHRRGSRRRR